METLREDEFAPVKNKSGVDSPETAKELMSNLFRRWLTSKSCEIPDETKMIEISPLLAVEPDDLHDNITIPPEEKVYLE